MGRSERKPGSAIAGALALLASASLILACGCGDDDDGARADPTVNVTGTWDFYTTETGGSEIGPDTMTLDQNGTPVTGSVTSPIGLLTISGTNSGGRLDITATGFAYSCTAVGIVTSHDHMQGTFADNWSQTGTWRAERQ